MLQPHLGAIGPFFGIHHRQFSMLQMLGFRDCWSMCAFCLGSRAGTSTAAGTGLRLGPFHSSGGAADIGDQGHPPRRAVRRRGASCCDAWLRDGPCCVFGGLCLGRPPGFGSLIFRGSRMYLIPDAVGMGLGGSGCGSCAVDWIPRVMCPVIFCVRSRVLGCWLEGLRGHHYKTCLAFNEAY